MAVVSAPIVMLPPSPGDARLALTTPRKTGLEGTMVLTGHEGEVLAVEFSPDGRNIASGSFDKTILIYRVYADCENWCILKGHQNAVLELHWSTDGTKLFTASADSTAAVWDVEAGKRLKKLGGHVALVSSCRGSRRGPPLLATGADDGTTKVWDLRARRCVKSFEHQYQIMAVTFDDSAERVFSGSLDNTIRVYDMRKGEEDLAASLVGHADSVTGLDMSNDGSFLLSNGMDQMLRVWNVNPFFEGSNRCIKILTGATHNFEKNLLRVRWSADDRLCASGSADRYVYVWDVRSGQLMYRLPGHQGSVNEVCFHPNEPILASGSSDKTVYMGELS